MPKTSVKESGATPKTPAKDSDTTPKRPAPKTPSIKSVKQIQITIPTPTPAPTPTPTRTEKTQATTPPNAGATPMSADGESNIKKNSRRSPDSFKSIK
uniref:Uncharacterized protein n=1 Tax=Panagrolaimus superbus TaxID=310955 RepID=A0A914YRA6_9BILA